MIIASFSSCVAFEAASLSHKSFSFSTIFFCSVSVIKKLKLKLRPLFNYSPLSRPCKGSILWITFLDNFFTLEPKNHFFELSYLGLYDGELAEFVRHIFIRASC